MINVGDGTGTATYVVTCNADGTGWTNGGQTVTAVECSETVVAGEYFFKKCQKIEALEIPHSEIIMLAACTQCATTLITVDPADPTDPGSKVFEMNP